jgi:hypothetical protein
MQRTQGNAAVLRALGSRGGGPRALQRAFLHLVMNPGHTLFFGINVMKYGYAHRYKVPHGYHITIYPDQASSEYALSDTLTLKRSRGRRRSSFTGDRSPSPFTRYVNYSK